MVSRFFTAVSTRFYRIGALMRRPEAFVFLPALTLAAFWLGGERDLILTALGAPLLFAISGAVRPQAPPPDQLQVLDGLSLRAQIVGNLDTILRESHLSGRTTACLVLQFDLAERIVEQHGRAAQTEVLARSAERICASLRAGDVVARLEGGGFAVALAAVRRLDIETVVQVAARLQSALATPISLNATRIYITCSIGFCLGNRAPDASGAALLNAAQIAADDAMRHGPSAIRSFSEDMAATRADRKALRDELELALDEGQIRPHFQPQISTHTGAISGFEALARWYHPDKGLIPPAEFLPMIEDAGLSERLGEVILYHALSALARWDRAGLSVPTVAVNFSSPELRNPRLAEKLKWELDRFDLEPKRLSIEVWKMLSRRRTMTSSSQTSPPWPVWAAASTSMISALATPRSPRSAALPCAASKSTAALSPGWMRIANSKKWWPRSCRWPSGWGWKPWPRAWKPPVNMQCCHN